jgi:hypothetical protein
MDPLKDITRKQRQYLLLSSLVGFVMSWGGIIPQRIEAWGISIEQLNTSAILWIIVGMITYFLVYFVIYTWSDLMDHTHYRFRVIYKYALMRISKRDNQRHDLWRKHFGAVHPAEIDNLEDRLERLDAHALLDLAKDLETIASSHEDTVPVRIGEITLFVKCCDRDKYNLLVRNFYLAKLLWMWRSRRILIDVVPPVVIGITAIISVIAFIVLSQSHQMIV